MRQPIGTGEVPNKLQLQIIRNKVGLTSDSVLFSNRFDGCDDTTTDERCAGLAARPRPAATGGGLRFDRHPSVGLTWQKAPGLSRPRLPGRRWLHGPRQLGDVVGRWVEVWLCASHDRASFELDGDPATGAVRAPRDCIGPRSRTSMP